VRQQKVTQIIHLQMRFEAVGCLCERMECESRIIDEDIHFAVVALLNYENLLRHFVKRVNIFCFLCPQKSFQILARLKTSVK
jgi:hypothetical protein